MGKPCRDTHLSGSRVPRREKAKVVFTSVLDDDITLIDVIASHIDSYKKVEEEDCDIKKF